MDNKARAIGFMLMAAFCFAMMGAMVKLSGDIPLFEKVFYRNVVSLFVAVGIVMKSKKRFFGKRENQIYLISRSLFGLSGVVLYFYAINNLVLADASMLNKLSPFFVTLFALIFLKEKLSPVQIIALILVFIGALFIIKPQFSFKMFPALSGFLSAIFAAGAYTILRVLRNKEDYSTIVFYFSFVSVIGMFPLMMMHYKQPTMIQFLFLISTGIFAAVAQFSITLAYKYAPAGEIAIYDYSNIIFSTILGFLFWNEIPDLLSFLGGVLIILAGGMVFVYNKKYNKKMEGSENERGSSQVQ